MDAQRTWSSDPPAWDWSRVQRTRYRIQQRITYRYDGPVQSLQQRLVVQPRSVHGDQRRISRRLSVLNAIPRRIDASVDVFGNTVVTLIIPRVEEEVTFVTSSVVERDAQHGPHLEPAAMLDDRRLLDATMLTGADPAIELLAEELRTSGLTGGGARIGRERMRPQPHDLRARRDVGRHHGGRGPCPSCRRVPGLRASAAGVDPPSRTGVQVRLGADARIRWVSRLGRSPRARRRRPRSGAFARSHARSCYGIPIHHGRRGSRLCGRRTALRNLSRPIRWIAHHDQTSGHDRARPERLRRRRPMYAPSPEPVRPLALGA